MSKANYEKWENEILALRSEIADLEKRIEIQDRTLQPMRRIIEEIRADIGRTHDRDANGVYVLDINRKEERAGLFQRLTYIAEHCGRDFEERRRLAQTSRAYKREVAQINRDIERQKRKESRKGSLI